MGDRTVQVEGIRVTHSLMDCLALAIETPVGTVIHTGDFKIDNTPMEGEMFDFQRFAAYGEKGCSYSFPILRMSSAVAILRRTRSRQESRTDISGEQRQDFSLDFFVKYSADSTGSRYFRKLRAQGSVERAQHDQKQPGCR